MESKFNILKGSLIEWSIEVAHLERLWRGLFLVDDGDDQRRVGGGHAGRVARRAGVGTAVGHAGSANHPAAHRFRLGNLCQVAHIGVKIIEFASYLFDETV